MPMTRRMTPALRTCAGALLLTSALAGSYACVAAQEDVRIDATALSRDVAVLAADSMEGRGAGTPGGARARTYLLQRFDEAGLRALPSGWEQAFDIPVREGTPRRGVNVMGFVRGTAQPDRWIVVTAHYDHLGTRDGEIFNGADDNASGTAGLLALATWFAAHPPAHSMLFVAFDAEELGLRGARAFLESPPVPPAAIALNVNLDMVGRNDAGELYVAGTAHYPELLPLVERVAGEAPVTLIPGHDRPGGSPSDDWTRASDHGPFHDAGIAFLYFGVEDHADYHRSTDDVAGIQPSFHARAVETVRRVIEAVDAKRSD